MSRQTLGCAHRSNYDKTLRFNYYQSDIGFLVRTSPASSVRTKTQIYHSTDLTLGQKRQSSTLTRLTASDLFTIATCFQKLAKRFVPIVNPKFPNCGTKELKCTHRIDRATLTIVFSKARYIDTEI